MTIEALNSIIQENKYWADYEARVWVLKEQYETETGEAASRSETNAGGTRYTWFSDEYLDWLGTKMKTIGRENHEIFS